MQPAELSATTPPPKEISIYDITQMRAMLAQGKETRFTDTILESFDKVILNFAINLSLNTGN